VTDGQVTGGQGTADLIGRLSRDLRPVLRHAVARRLARGLAVPGLLSLALVVLGLGLRPGMPGALGTGMFWVKLGYTGALALAGAGVTARLARPVGRVAGRAAWGAVPLLAILGLAAWQMAAAPQSAHHTLVMGASAASCPWLIVVVAAPLFAGLVWALRGMAPTRLALAGLFAGLTAGAAGAMLYALHCPEVGAPFVALWYTLGIAAAGVAGGLAGPKVLRW